MNSGSYIRCLNCAKLYVTNVNLVDHWNNGLCNYFCRICGKSFDGNIESIDRHSLDEHGVKPPRLIVGRKVKAGAAVKTETVPAATAAATTATNSKTKATAKKKSGNISSGPFGCPKCRLSFAYRSTLKRHYNTHHGSMPELVKSSHSEHRVYQCRYCDREFAQRGPLSNHMKSHTNSSKRQEKPIKIKQEICDPDDVPESPLDTTEAETDDFDASEPVTDDLHEELQGELQKELREESQSEHHEELHEDNEKESEEEQQMQVEQEDETDMELETNETEEDRPQTMAFENCADPDPDASMEEIDKEATNTESSKPNTNGAFRLPSAITIKRITERRPRSVSESRTSAQDVLDDQTTLNDLLNRPQRPITALNKHSHPHHPKTSYADVTKTGMAAPQTETPEGGDDPVPPPSKPKPLISPPRLTVRSLSALQAPARRHSICFGRPMSLDASFAGAAQSSETRRSYDELPDIQHPNYSISNNVHALMNNGSTPANFDPLPPAQEGRSAIEDFFFYEAATDHTYFDPMLPQLPENSAPIDFGSY